MRYFLNLWRVLRVSRVLDDRTDRSNRAAAEFDDQGRIDAELADSRRLPWRHPSSRVRSRVLLEIESRRYLRRRTRGLPMWPLRLAAAAALGLFVWGLPVWNRGATKTGPEMVVAALNVPSEIVRRGVEDDLRDEAAAIGEDTRRAAELLLERLPFGGD